MLHVIACARRGFKNAINVPTSAVNKFIDEFLKRNINLEFKKISEEDVSLSLDDYVQGKQIEPLDNLNIQTLIVKPLANTQE